jgi:hypothetical protein
MTNLSKFAMGAFLLIAAGFSAAEVQRTTEPYAQLTAGERAKMWRGGKSLAGVYQEAFNLETAVSDLLPTENRAFSTA